jgi:cardiolipin synthase
MNIPNLLTLTRILLIPGIVICLINHNLKVAFVLFIAAAITDALDGLIAKLFNQATQVGAFIDPIADKLLIGATCLTLAIQGLFPVWLTILIISRDFIILLGIGVMTYSQKTFIIRPHIDSKITTLAQLALLCFILGKDILALPDFLGFHLITITALLTVFSGIRYIIAGLRIVEE